MFQIFVHMVVWRMRMTLMCKERNLMIEQLKEFLLVMTRHRLDICYSFLKLVKLCDLVMSNSMSMNYSIKPSLLMNHN